MAYKNKADATAYQNKFIAKAYDRVNLTLPKGQKEVVQAHAAAHGESVNGFIGRAISETMERDGSGASPVEMTGQQDTGAAMAERDLAKRPTGSPQESTETSTGAGAVLPSEAVRTVQEGTKTGKQPAPVDKVKAAENLFRILGDLGTVDLDKARCERLGIMYLPPDTLEAAQRAAERTGETAAAFVARAVADQEKRDDRSFQMGINPA